MVLGFGLSQISQDWMRNCIAVVIRYTRNSTRVVHELRWHIYKYPDYGMLILRVLESVIEDVQSWRAVGCLSSL
ncbi:hypothetical protein ZWY2020_054866 [Hordeum vulgare]|nr:hypothetical protein ZWY2020_051157 [Hordeum vulgare]KAI4998985.1 hypothetical protein ZWY2020_054866 [Hordeum vulgare]